MSDGTPYGILKKRQWVTHPGVDKKIEILAKGEEVIRMAKALEKRARKQKAKSK